MALWGNTDLVANTSTITIDLSTGVITGAATTFSDAGVEAGDVISIGVGATMGEAVISSVTSNTVAAVATTQFITSGGLTNIPTGTTYTISEKPVYTLEDTNYSATEIYGVDTTEQSVVNAASGDARKYAPAHAGWVGIQTYIDTHGTLRVKTETLVAGSTINLDAADSAQFPNA
jgi:hypothetical protein